MAFQDTIFALSTAPGRAGVAVVRVSGPAAGDALAALTGGVIAVRSLPPRTVRRARLVDGAGGAPLDDGLVLYFPRPGSFTGEDVVEFHLHGGRAVVAGVLEALGRVPRLRLAEAGEFTRRAFDNGKLDLTEAEGLADLIDAETESQRTLALRHAGGALHRAAEGWRADIIAAQALAESAIDFADEGDVSGQALTWARAEVRRLAGNLERHLDDQHRGEILRDGFSVVVAGPPNAGKSSLINCLAGRDAVIVSEEAGTTRDVVELHLNLGGVRVIVADTAGLRETEGKVEREGIRRGVARARAAHLVVWVTDAGGVAEDIPAHLAGADAEVIRVSNKCDLVAARDGEKISGDGVSLSALTGEGFDRLVERIAAAAARRTDGGTGALISQVRHRAHLVAAHAALAAFLSLDDAHADIGAEHLRTAASELGRLTGRIDVEDVLGAIFSRFCIGK